jgi:hypothetical protein
LKGGLQCAIDGNKQKGKWLAIKRKVLKLARENNAFIKISP